ncbi:Hypothetical Protein RRSL_01287 [Ralstonia solanacearum UW551]|uniref:Uncharacterized protein n=1 Tax=Ralstonia solanacearum (strain UW551) TaxID=342110 RepID=A0AB33V9C4_RALSU|nr:Hypothetical Protein RRSL_01287 [Ralstonia solanacearum UW551]
MRRSRPTFRRQVPHRSRSRSCGNVIRPVEPGNGRRAARRAAGPRACRAGQRDRAAPRRERHPRFRRLPEKQRRAVPILVPVSAASCATRDKGGDAAERLAGGAALSGLRTSAAG